MKLRSNNRVLIIFVGVSLLSSLSCSKAVESISDLYSLRAELMREYNVEDINVVIQNANVLGISVINSAFNDLSEQEKERKAQEIAFFAKNHYKSIQSVDRIWVAFLASNTFIFFHFNQTMGVFSFETMSLTSADPKDVAQPDTDAVASYNPDLNVIDVYLKKNLQLFEGADNSVTLFPHFALPCVGTAPRRPVPENVTLDVSTSANKRMFQHNPQLVIFASGRTVFSGQAKATEVMGSTAENSVNEFFSYEISYTQFLELTDSEKVNIALGARKFDLTPAQLEELRSMRKAIDEISCP
jgi:hypothetical protein